MRLRLVVVLGLLTASPAAMAARPFVTDDARVVDKGGCQVETFVKRQQRFKENEFWFLPACNPWGAELTLGYIGLNSTPACQRIAGCLRSDQRSVSSIPIWFSVMDFG